ncbi:metalloprotease, putative [Entamoeba invadens IP1]|uniref:Metalloprotease, putative n=1 Tax=Entamoeba invadens IP1 TaxID=370355 RepID=A0A0A1TU63_ENTIV|nr:metalloprotease, putative [Entamoeba invadens IP1]ELP83449.1 metalloprotease, putative [Entamoeba invadens IP1]|eukprot:XP_004182795.1 metalloprotease, putative [Entamoeba invadens IP1]
MLGRLSPSHTVILHKLTNGVKMLGVVMSGYNRVSSVVHIPTGSFDDPPQRDGLSHFTEHVLLRGNAEYPVSALYRMNQSEKLLVSGSTSREYTQFLSESNKGTRDLSVMLNMVTAPRFKNEVVEYEKQIVSAERRQVSKEKSSVYVQRVHEELFGKSTAFGHDILGSEESVRSFSAEDVSKFYNQKYRIGQCLFGVLAGDQHTVNNVFQVVERALSEYCCSNAHSYKIVSHSSHNHSLIRHPKCCDHNKCIIRKTTEESMTVADVTAYVLNRENEAFHIPYKSVDIVISTKDIAKNTICVNDEVIQSYLNDVRTHFHRTPLSVLNYYLQFVFSFIASTEITSRKATRAQFIERNFAVEDEAERVRAISKGSLERYLLGKFE